ncbi:uncharacterized protein LOC133178653 [Saccostrea echinata]|uniref:uncharacterized protein LOC133178653 n=1 Tax=Saccostrea echinata TaxID=191078 RepID=UPI002A80136A|nr:uncharacterized protein LOC133178653 [Saccostrea echinata]
MGNTQGKPTPPGRRRAQKQDAKYSPGEVTGTPSRSDRRTVYQHEESTEGVVQDQRSLSVSLHSTSTQISTSQLLTRQQSVNAQAAVDCSLKDVGYEMTSGTLNFYLLARLLLDVCSDALRDLLRCKIGGGEGILTKAIYQSRDRLNHLSSSQKNLIMPPDNKLVQYDTLDFTLLYTIFRNVCRNKIESDARKWGKPPLDGDSSLLAALERIRLCRNNCFAHATSARVDDIEFKKIWEQVEKSLQKIDENLEPAIVSICYLDEMKKLKENPIIDPKTKPLLQQLAEKEKQLMESYEMSAETDRLLEDLIGIRKKYKKNICAFKSQLSVHSYRLKDPNIGQTEHYLKECKMENEFYVKTSLFCETEKFLKKYNCVIIVGKPGTGKTGIATQLMFKYCDEFVVRKLDSPTDFQMLVDPTMKSFIFIDNIFDCTDVTLKDWWKKFDYIEKFVCSKCVNQKVVKSDNASEDTEAEVPEFITYVVMTTRPHLLEAAKDRMDKTHSLLEKYVLDIDSEQFSLSAREKRNILEAKFKYASQVKNIKEEEFSKEDWTSIFESCPPFGFPLCAHLFACDERYRKDGTKFFSNPHQYMLDGLKDVLNIQRSRRREALFILMLVCDMKNTNVAYDDEDECWKVLSDLGLTDIDELSLKKKDVKDLPQAASDLEETYLRECSTQGYIFIHPSVREAVENYFIQKYTQKAIEILPMHVLSRKLFAECCSDEHAPLMNLLSEQRLAKRLVKEINEGNICEVCKFPGLKNKNFSGVFLSEITQNAETVKNVMSVKDTCGFPFMYWFTAYALLDTVLQLLKHEILEEALTESEILMQYGYSLIASCASEKKIKITGFILEKYSGKGIQNFYGDENSSSLGEQSNQGFIYPLSEALRARNEEAIQLLMEKEACFPSSTWKGWPFLHACHNEPKICCSEFLEAVLSFDRNESLFESNEEKGALKYDQIRGTEETFLESIVSKVEKSIRLHQESCQRILLYLVQIPDLEISDGIIHAFCSIPEIKHYSEKERLNPLNFVDDNGNTILHLLLNYQKNQPTMAGNYDDIAQPEDDTEKEDRDETLPMLPEEVTGEYQRDVVFERMEEKSVHLRTIRRFYKKGADINMKNKMGETPLIIEISKFCPSIDVVKSLLHYQANPNAQDIYGRTCLHTLLLQNYEKNIQVEKFLALLIKSGADVNMVDKFGNSPILLELKRQRPRKVILNQLIDAQIDMRIADSNGKTALRVALSASYENDIMKKEIVKILLKSKSVDVLSRNKTGISAFRFALEDSNIEDNILIQIALHDSCCFPLHECIKEDVEETIKIEGITQLLSTGNDKLQISAKDPDDRTLLITAAQACPHMHKLFDFLLSRDVPINSKDSYGKSALFYLMESDAEFSAREASFNLLLAKRPLVNDEIENFESHSPLLKAMQSMVCRSFLFDPMEFPSEAMANKITTEESPKKHVSRIGGLFPDRVSDLKIEVVQRMLDICTADLNFSVDEKHRTYLHYCASSRLADKQTLAICKRLVELGVDVDQKDKDGLTCIDMAFKFYEKKFDTLVFLMEKSTHLQDLDIDKLLEHLADNANLYEKLVQYLIENIFELNKPKRNLFHYLASIGYYAKDQPKVEREAVFDKLQENFPANEKNKDGQIPLHTAIESNTSVSCIRSFVRISISYLDERDFEGNTALHLVLKSDREDVDVLTIVKKMLKFKVDINAQNDLDRTPLMIAVRCDKDRTSTIKELLNHKERPDLLLRDRAEFSILHHCIDTPKDDFTAHCILSIFLDSGLSLPIKSKTLKGLTALNYAAKYVHFSRILCIIKMLQTKGCSTEAVDKKGQSPLYNSATNLKGVNPLIVLERLLRAYIFLIHGDSDMKTNNGDSVSSVCEKFDYISLQDLLDIDIMDSDKAYDIIKRAWITVSSGQFPKNNYEHLFKFKDEKIKSLILDSLPYLSHRMLDNLKNEEPLVDDTCLSSVPDLEHALSQQ